MHIKPVKCVTIYRTGFRFKDRKDNEDNSFVITIQEIREAVLLNENNADISKELSFL
jgi:hypothetical protein